MHFLVVNAVNKSLCCLLSHLSRVQSSEISMHRDGKPSLFQSLFPSPLLNLISHREFFVGSERRGVKMRTVAVHNYCWSGDDVCTQLSGSKHEWAMENVRYRSPFISSAALRPPQQVASTALMLLSSWCLKDSLALVEKYIWEPRLRLPAPSLSLPQDVVEHRRGFISSMGTAAGGHCLLLQRSLQRLQKGKHCSIFTPMAEMSGGINLQS